MSIPKLLIHLDRGGSHTSGFSTKILEGDVLELVSLGVTVTKKRVQLYTNNGWRVGGGDSLAKKKGE